MKQFFKTDKNGQRTNISKSTAVNAVRNGLTVSSFDALSLIECGLLPQVKGFIFDVETKFKFKPFIGPFTNFTVVYDNLKKLFDDGLGQLTDENEFNNFLERKQESTKT